MKVVIVGAGSVGFQIAKQLIDEKKDVILIEKNPKVARHASNYLDCMVINEEGNNLEVLKKAGIEGADFFIAVTESDEVNMISCGLVANRFKVPNKIARVKNIDYSNVQNSGPPFLGIEHIVNPEIEAAKEIIRSIEHGALSDVLFFEKSSFQMRNINISSNSPFKDKTLKELREITGVDFLVCFILRENDYIIPSGETKVQEEDNLYILATEENLEKLFIQAGKFRGKLNRIVIVGGGRIGSYVAHNLLELQKWNMRFLQKITRSFAQKWKQNVVIIERDIERCKELAERFPDAIILNEDVSEEGVYEEGQLHGYDLIVAATGDQELNIITAVYAKTLGIKRSIAVVNKISYLNMAPKLGIDVAISQNASMVNTILKLIRRGNIRNIYSFADGKVEVIELLVENSEISGKKIKEFRLPPQTLIVSLTRDHENILPDGERVINNGDYIVVIAQKESIPRLEKIFTGI